MLIRNEVVATTSGPCPDTIREYRPPHVAACIERTVRWIANRQLYSVVLKCRDDHYLDLKSRIEKVIESLVFTPPETGATLEDGARSRWLQREFRFSLDLPKGWRPVLAPAEIALF
jgi:hypothetical protein